MIIDIKKAKIVLWSKVEIYSNFLFFYLSKKKKKKKRKNHWINIIDDKIIFLTRLIIVQFIKMLHEYGGHFRDLSA